MSMKDNYAFAMAEIVEKPSTVFEVNGIFYCITYAVSKDIRNEIRDILSDYACTSCNSRKRVSLVGHHGPNGPLLLMNISEGNLDNTLRRLRDFACRTLDLEPGLEPRLTLVKDGTFPEVIQGAYSAEGKEDEPWTHYTIMPHSVTSNDNVNKFEPLWKAYRSCLDVRIGKFIDPSKTTSLITSAAEKSRHPCHWLPTINWIDGIRVLACGKSFEEMNNSDKFAVRVFALTSGSSYEGTHYDFHKSEMLVEFMSYVEEETIIEAMNERRDERNYQVSAVASAMANNKVTDPRTISLAWGSKDDLDLHVVSPSGNHVFYGCKEIGSMKLNFDANAGSKVASPVENVSVFVAEDGAYKVYCNNFNNQGREKDITFDIVIKDVGVEDVIHEGIWMGSMGSNNTNDLDKMILVCCHTFDTKIPDVIVTDKEERRTSALSNEWDKCFGRLGAVVAREEDSSNFVSLIQTESRSFLRMAANSSLRHPGTFTSIGSFIEFLETEGVAAFVKVHDVSPGYMTKITTHEAVTWCPVSPCHYRDQGYLPTFPSSRGNARGNSEWFPGKTENDVVRIKGFLVNDKYVFMSLADAQIPYESSAFPLGAGIYATSLKPQYHSHRSQWQATGTAVIPTIPSVPQRTSDLLVGGFVFKDMKFVIGSSGGTVTIAGLT